jgi:hypothetical protein
MNYRRESCQCRAADRVDCLAGVLDVYECERHGRYQVPCEYDGLRDEPAPVRGRAS